MNVFNTLASLVLFLNLVAPSVAGQDPRTQTPGSVSGRITIHGKPASDTIVILSVAGGGISTDPSLKSKTDYDGQYTIAGVRPGSYTLSAFAPAFLSPSQGQAPSPIPGKAVTVDDGEAVEGIDVDLIRGGVITGRVTDAVGRPVVEEYVKLTAVDEMGRPRPNYFFNPFGFNTDDRGVYRIFGVPPGRYRVWIGERNDGTSITMGFGRVFYSQRFHPDTSDESKAEIVTVASGAEATGVDIRAIPPSRTFFASGRVVDAETGKPVPNVRCGHGGVRPEMNQIGSYGWSGNVTNAKGEFRLESLSPGSYATFVVYDGPSEYYSDPTLFEIKDADVSNLEIKLRRGASISGMVAIEGTDDPDLLSKVSQLRIFLSVESDQLKAPTRGQIQISPDGSFRASGLPAGKVRVSLPNFTSQPKGFALSRVELDGADKRDGIPLAGGEQIAGVRVAVIYGSGTIRGQVVIQGGELQPGAWLTASARPLNIQQPSSSLSSRVDARGRFLLEGLASGEYEVAIMLWESASSSGPVPGPSRGRPIFKQTVSASGPQTEITLQVDLSKRRDR